MKNLFSTVRTAWSRRKKKQGTGADSGPESQQTQPFSKDLDTNLQKLKDIFSLCSDVIFREFLINQQEGLRGALIYIDGLADKTMISDQIMKTNILELPMAEPGLELTRSNAFHIIKNRCLSIHQVKETTNLADVIDGITSGDTVLLIDGFATALINGVRGWETRKVTSPEAEVVIRGPQEAFVETLRTNTSMLRRKIKNPNLKIETLKLGEVTNTDVAIAYIKGIVHDDIVAEVRRRLGAVKVDSILESGYVEEIIGDGPLSPFPLVNHSERPDKIAAMLLEGRVAIFTDGTPEVLTVPTLFIEFIHSPDDYYEKFYHGSLVRIVRFGALIMTLALPSLYVAVITFQQEMLPTPLMLSIAGQREMVPFPAFMETLIMEISFEALREAGVRLPRQVGQAVSIVGALIIGEAAVRAGIVAAATVIIVAVTGISSFMLSTSAGITIRMLRFPMMVLSATMGLFGLSVGLVTILVHLATLRSFGVPYLSPVAPTTTGDLKDVLFRAPWWAMFTRPRLLGGMKDPQRQQFRLKPTPPETRE